jgi:MOSC domain-containing protein YiiM
MGFYVAVTREGEVGAGDEIKEIAHDPNAVPVGDITHLYIAKLYGVDELNSIRRALQVAVLPESWKGYFRERLQHAHAG